jgi:hypothetical protein
MRLSRNFQLQEMLVSQTAVRAGIDMTPDEQVLANLKKLARVILQPARDLLREAIIITSGYRPRDLNTLIGGSPSSDHILGCAADIFTPHRSPFELATFIHRHATEEDWPVKQLIHEFGSWVHVSTWPEGFEDGVIETLTAYRDGGTRYVHGLREVSRDGLV